MARLARIRTRTPAAKPAPAPQAPSPVSLRLQHALSGPPLPRSPAALPADHQYYDWLKDLYTVAGLVDETGEVVEGYAYDTYGKVRMYRVEGQIADADRDGDVDISDFEVMQRCYRGEGNAIPAGCSLAEVEQLDVDRDTDIDEQDLSQFLECWQGPAWAVRSDGDYDDDGWVTPADVDAFFVCLQKNLPLDPQCSVFDFNGDGGYDPSEYGTLAGLVGYPAGTPWGGCVVAQSESEIGNPYYFTGQRLDLIGRPGMPIMVPAQIYHYRARWYDPVHGRFGQRGPLFRFAGQAYAPTSASWGDSQDLFMSNDKLRGVLFSLYQYSASRPAYFMDPDGTCPNIPPNGLMWAEVTLGVSDKYFSFWDQELAAEVDFAVSIPKSKILSDPCCNKVGIVQIAREKYGLGQPAGNWALDGRPWYPYAEPQGATTAATINCGDNPGWDRRFLSVAHQSFRQDFETCVACESAAGKITCLLSCFTWSYAYTATTAPPPDHTLKLTVDDFSVVGSPKKSGEYDKSPVLVRRPAGRFASHGSEWGRLLEPYR